MVDARVSGARAERRAGSSPVLGTMKEKLTKDVDFSFLCILSFFSYSDSLFCLYIIIYLSLRISKIIQQKGTMSPFFCIFAKNIL